MELLPPELLAEIINHIPDDKSLRNCSLVAKSWVYPSQRCIFRAVNVSRTTRLKSWSETISPTNIEVLQHVRSLTYNIANTPGSRHPPLDFLRDYSPSLPHLKRLIFFSGFLPSPTQLGTYSPFQRSLSFISLWGCSVTVSRLVTLVNYFPNLAHLELMGLSHKVDGRPALPFSRPLQKLTVTDLYTNGGLVLLDQLMGLHPQCDEVAIGMYATSCPSLAQRVIDGVKANVKRLNLKSNLACAFSVPTMA